MKGKFDAEGEASLKQLECYQRVAGSLRRLLESLGLKRGPRTSRLNRSTTRAEFDRRKAEEVAP